MKIRYSASAGSEKPEEKRPPCGEQAILHVYNTYREQFIAYAAKRYSLQRVIADEIYQESFLALYSNISEGRLTELTSSLKTYIFKIGTHKICNHFRRSGKMPVELTGREPDPVDSAPEAEEWMRMQEITGEVVLTMKEPCSTILKFYYWEQQTMSQIARAMNYGSEQVAKNRKSICMKKLRILLSTRLKNEGLFDDEK